MLPIEPYYTRDLLVTLDAVAQTAFPFWNLFPNRPSIPPLNSTMTGWAGQKLADMLVLGEKVDVGLKSGATSQHADLLSTVNSSF